MSKIVLMFTNEESASKREIERAGGRIIHRLTSRVIAAELPGALDPSQLKASFVHPPADLDAVSRMAVEAWKAHDHKKRQGAGPDPKEGLPWDAPGHEPPHFHAAPKIKPRIAAGLGSISQAASAENNDPLGSYLVGSIAVGLVMVSRDQGAEAMPSWQQTKIFEEVIAGLGWLANLEPRAMMSVFYDIQTPIVTVDPGPDNAIADDYEKYERGWRDAALAAMGYSAGEAGYRAYADDIRLRHGTLWSYVAFFTNYPLKHYGYANLERVVMTYQNGDWGSNAIDRVFAYETCYIFCAQDEYGTCTCGTTSGRLQAPNNNCVNCSGSHETCLMGETSWGICQWSRQQIGWDDSLYPEASWHHSDLTAELPNAPSPGGSPWGYFWGSDSSEHVVYRGIDNHIHELVYKFSWNHNDVTAATGAAPAIGDPMGYAWNGDGTQHIVYRTLDAHIHEFWSRNGWGHNDLTDQTGAPIAFGPPMGYAWDSDGTQHIIYRSSDDHIHEFWHRTGGWGHNDLTDQIGAPAADGDPQGFAWESDGTQHIVYRTSDGHIHELWYRDDWKHVDLTALIGAPAAAPGADPFGYAWNDDNSAHIVYRSADGHIHELQAKNGWTHTDLTADVGAPLAAGDPTGYAWEKLKSQHVIYEGTDGHLHELRKRDVWTHNDLSLITGCPDPRGRLSSFVVNDLIAVLVYLGADGHIHELWAR